MSRKVTTNYQSLDGILTRAYNRACYGKGLERHADNKPFEEQDIVSEGDTFGIHGHLFQIRKKAKEILRLDTPEAQQNELLDIIVYAAGAVIILDKEE